MRKEEEGGGRRKEEGGVVKSQVAPHVSGLSVGNRVRSGRKGQPAPKAPHASARQRERERERENNAIDAPGRGC